MNDKEKTIKLLLKHQDHFQIRFQLDSSFQRAYMMIGDEEIRNGLNKEEAYSGNLSFELFRNVRDDDSDEYNVFDHISFLRNIHKYCLSPSHYSISSRQYNIGMGLFVLLKNDKLVTRLEESIEEEIGKLKLRVLDMIGGHYDFDVDNFKEGKDKKVEYHKGEVDNLQKQIGEYKETSKRYKEIKREIRFNKKIIGIIK